MIHMILKVYHCIKTQYYANKALLLGVNVDISPVRVWETLFSMCVSDHSSVLTTVIEDLKITFCLGPSGGLNGFL